MPLVCWTIVHQIPAAIIRHVPKPARHLKTAPTTPVRHAAHHGLHAARPHHVVHVIRKAARPRYWVETVCRMVPGALLGGGLLLAPPPAIRTAPLAQPAPVVQPLPAAWYVPLVPPPAPTTQPDQLPPPDLSGTDLGDTGDAGGGGGTRDDPTVPPPTDEWPTSGEVAVDEAPGSVLLLTAVALLALARRGGRPTRAADEQAAVPRHISNGPAPPSFMPR